NRQKKAPARAPALYRRGTGRRPDRCRWSPKSVDDRHTAAVLRPGGLVRAEHGGTLLAVADRLDAVGRDAQRHQRIAYRRRAALAEGEVVLARAALVAMTLDRHRHVRIFLQPLGLTLQRGPALGLDRRLVEVEEDAVAAAPPPPPALALVEGF